MKSFQKVKWPVLLHTLFALLAPGFLAFSNSAFSAPPRTSGSCIPAGTMPVTPDMCQMMPTMCGCDKFPHDPSLTSRRRKVEPEVRKPFPQTAPGIEAFEKLGYCTGIDSGATQVISLLGKNSIELGTRRYTLALKQETEPKTGRAFLRTTLEDQETEAEGRKRKCSPLSQMENGVTAKNRPVNAPPLFFIEGETAEITVINSTSFPTSIHWHGLILPNNQDGIVDITQAPITPGEKKIYRFLIQQHGTYWYHPHDLNEQDTKGAFIILPNPVKEAATRTEFGGIDSRYHQDRVIMLTDYKERKTLTILNYLRDEDRNAYETDSGIHKGWLSQLQCAKEYLDNFQAMKMFWMDRADVWYNSFFMNDETCLNCGEKTQKVDLLHTESPNQSFKRLNEFSNILPGERVRLRIINSSASTYFFLDYGNSDQLQPERKLNMMIVAKDGLAVKPLFVDQIYIGMGETYDVLVEVPDDGTLFELRAKSIDDILSKRVVRTLIGHNPPEEKESTQVVSARDVPVQICGPYPELNDQLTEVNYSQLQTTNNKTKASPSELHPFEVYHREKPIARYHLALSGSMEDYHWKISGAEGTSLKSDSMHMPYLNIKEDHRIRITIENSMVMGMMNHPWHLHGNWFRIIKESDTDDQIAKKALLHTATIFPGQKVTLEFYSDPAYRGAWMFHCHNLYHMANDMMMYLKYDTLPEDYTDSITHRHHSSSGWMPQGKNQYVVAGIGAQVGTDGAAGTVQFRYRATLGDNLGFISFNGDLSSGNLNRPSRDFEFKGRVRYNFEPNKSVLLDLQLQNPKSSTSRESSAYLGGQYQPWNSELLVVEAGAGSTCKEDLETKAISCSPAIKANAGTTWDAGWNTKVTGVVGCEGAYCSEFYAKLQISVTPHPRILIKPVNCKLSTNQETTACWAEINFVTDPIPIGD